jgi:hypothetical protein
MDCFIVAEGSTDTAWLKWALAPETKRYRISFLEGGGKSAAMSLARSILAVRRDPVILVLDADTADPKEVRELEQVVREAIGLVAPESIWRVFLAVPVLEAWLLADPDFLRGVLKADPTDDGSVRQDPKEVITALFQKARLKYTPKAIEKLSKGSKLLPLRETEPIQAIRRALEELTAAGARR